MSDVSQLLELQSRFGHDARFKMDGRFAEKDASEDEEDGGQDADVGEDDDADADAAAETDRQMAILSSLVPMAPPSLSRKAKTVESALLFFLLTENFTGFFSILFDSI